MDNSFELRNYDARDFALVASFLRSVGRLDSDVDGPEDSAFEAFSRIDVNRDGQDFRLLFSGAIWQLSSSLRATMYVIALGPCVDFVLLFILGAVGGAVGSDYSMWCPNRIFKTK